MSKKQILIVTPGTVPDRLREDLDIKYTVKKKHFQNSRSILNFLKTQIFDIPNIPAQIEMRCLNMLRDTIGLARYIGHICNFSIIR